MLIMSRVTPFSQGHVVSLVFILSYCTTDVEVGVNHGTHRNNYIFYTKLSQVAHLAVLVKIQEEKNDLEKLIY